MISKLVLKLIGIEDQTKKPSGDNAEELFLESVKSTFVDRYPEEVRYLENVLVAKDFLSDKPKWSSWQSKENSEGTTVKKPRPTGNKKAKQMEQDRKLVEELLATDEKKRTDSDSRKGVKEDLIMNIGQSIGKVGSSIDIMVGSK